MDNVVVSVCISVHNTADFLERCLDSVAEQGIDGLEIVLVNNGSTDNSEEIMLNYIQNHTNLEIRMASQEDRGLAQGRQTGINLARGTFITFLDADDYLIPGSYEIMLEHIKNIPADIYEFWTEREGKILKSPYFGIQRTKNILRDYFEGINIPTMLWLRWYRRELFDTPVLPDIYANNEDNFALPCLLYRADSIAFIPKLMHVYSTDNEKAVMVSLQRKKELSKKYFENRKIVLKSIKHIENYIGKHVLQAQYANEFIIFKIRTMMSIIFAPIEGVTYQQKLQSIVEEMEFSSSRELTKYIRRYCICNNTANKLIKLFGLHAVYVLRKMKGRSII